MLDEERHIVGYRLDEDTMRSLQKAGWYVTSNAQSASFNPLLINLDDLDEYELNQFLEQTNNKRHDWIGLTGGQASKALGLGLKYHGRSVLTKPLSLSALERHMTMMRSIGQFGVYVDQILPDAFFSESFEQVAQRVLKGAQTSVQVSVYGETGTGKEVVSRAIHRMSHRCSGPFIAINCGAIPESLLESELFGHERGAFTGAHATRIGKFEAASGGTLFLDEVGELPLHLQVKLLRVLETGCLERVGGNKPIFSDFRLIVATHRSLSEMVAAGEFREDLYYRISALSITLPALHTRRQDILDLWDHFICRFSQSHARSVPKTSTQAQNQLLAYRWPGNIRELQNIARRALTLANELIKPEHLCLHPVAEESVGEARKRPLFPGASLKEVEKYAILETYTALKDLKTTAEVLGISLRKLQYRLQAYREEENTKRNSGVTVILAEDDEQIRGVLEGALQREGYRVRCFDDGASLLCFLGETYLSLEQQPDAIVTDVRMPKLDGLSFIKGIRERGWTTPVIVMSAHPSDRMAREVKAMAADFLPKPFDLNELKRLLSAAMQERIKAG